MKVYHSCSSNSYIDISKVDGKPFPGNKIISLFSGAGGLDIGLEQAGFETAVCVEIDADCRETLRKNRAGWKLAEKNGVKNVGNIKNITASELLRMAKLKKGEAALVVGGAPCQPFSNIGKRNGIRDPKDGDLFLDFVRIVKRASPKAFIFENVQGITHAAHQEVIDYMKKKLNGLGYSISYSVLNAADYGVPQKRLRFILIGIKGGNKPGFPLPTNFENPTLWNEFIAGFNKRPDIKPKKWLSINQTFSRISKAELKRDDCLVMNISEIVKKRMEYIKPGENFKVLPLNKRPNCWKNGRHQGGDTFGRLKLNEPSVTIRTAAYNPSKGRYIHPLDNRGLNTIELARIQGFPSSWKFYCANKPKLTLVSVGKQIGNAVPPPLAKALGLALKEQIRFKSMHRISHSPMSRSENMSRIRATENSVEIILRKGLWRKGYRYRKNDKSVFGKPDIVFKNKKIAVFCDSKFWHGIDYLKGGKLPKTNRKFWREKLTRNIERDKIVNNTLKKEGWTIIRLYDKDIKKNVFKCIRKIEKYLEK